LIASLGMYLRRETTDATDRFWHAIRDRLRAQGIAAPEDLAREDMFGGAWASPDLLFSQTCGMPYRLELHGKVTLFGTPDYGLESCPPGYYASPFVVRGDDPREDLRDFEAAKFAFTNKTSQSGWAAAQNHAAGLGFRFQNLWQSGGHLASAIGVVNGDADITGLDGMTWRLIQRYEDFANKLRVIGMTEPTPGLPYITGLDRDGDLMFDAVSGAIDDLDAESRDILCLKGLVRIPVAEYLAVPNP
jgi:ABC-type phosphate/phosphonate transport system substrate-binding protein